MANYGKKLHIHKDGFVTDIELYTTLNEVQGGQGYLTLRDGTNLLYAKAGLTTDNFASPLKMKRGGTVYSVLTKASMAGQVIDEYNYIDGNTSDLQSKGWLIESKILPLDWNLTGMSPRGFGYIEKNVPIGNPMQLLLSGSFNGDFLEDNEWCISTILVLSVNSSGVSTVVYNSAADQSLPYRTPGGRFRYGDYLDNKSIPLPASTSKVRIVFSYELESDYGAVSFYYFTISHHKLIYI